MTERTGRCMCGAVTFAATDVPTEYGACHCDMCRRWAGAVLLAVTVPVKNVDWQGKEYIATLQSSDWAERAWCSKCGSGLYYHVTLPGEMSENYELPIGLFDDTSGMKMTGEIYVDHRLPSLVFAGERAQMTRKQVLEKFGIPDDGKPA